MSTKALEILLGQMYAQRTQLECSIALLENELGAAPAADKCPHPAEMRMDASTMGTPPKFKCRKCGETVEGIA